MKEPVIIGDVHGCLEELTELLDKVGFNANPNKFLLIFLGDLTDRGPYSYECVKFVRQLCELGHAECVDSNHDNKHVRYRSFELKKALTGKENPMKPMSPIDLEAHRKLTEDDIRWMRNLPKSIRIKDSWYAIHGGLEPYLDFNSQLPDKIIRTRYVSDGSYRKSDGSVIERGKSVPLMKDKSQPQNSVYWADIWEGSESIIYGHNVYGSPNITLNKNNICIGIDTGCVFGGSLTGYLFYANDFVQVKAKREYFSLNYRFED